MRKRLNIAGAVLLLAVGAASAGCHTMYPVASMGRPQAARPFGSIEIGDLVSVQLQDGSRHRFEVRGIEGDALVAESGRRYPHSEMTRLERERVNPQKTTGLVGGIVAGSLLVIRVLDSIQFFGN